jgi:hypothetical protein
MNQIHDWKLVAPWYRWSRQLADEARQPRQTRPIFQKFDQSDFVRGFGKDPQRSLKFKDEVDTVFKVHLSDATKATTGTFSGKFTRFFMPSPGQPSSAKNASLVPTGIRKLFLDTHKRYYVVVCELHCDAPGFPTVGPDQVCQAEFVVRRRSFDFPGGAKKEAVQLLQKIVGIQAEIAQLEQTVPARGRAAERRARMIQKMIAEGTLESKKAELRDKLAQARLELKQWKDDNGVVAVHEGWVPGDFKNIGSWQIVEETPQQILESTFPLYHLFPDPNIPDHSAKGRNIYFGVVPTSGLDTDDRGNSRFDDQSLYEIRCFVRQHKPECPRKDQAPDCSGEVVWSEPTESYKLASHNDLLGTAQRPVTIQMPDLGELAAQVGALPLNRFSPVKVVQPQRLDFTVNDGKAESPSVGPSQICFFAIPLITIVAFFVLKLFLPVVVFLFNLFFLLSLKFCIPPSISISAGLKAELDAIPPGIDVDVGLSASVALQLNEDLKVGIASDSGVVATERSKLDEFSNAALLPLGTRIETASSLTIEEAANAGLDLTANLEFETRVELKAT